MHLRNPLSSPASASPSIDRKYKPAKPFLAIVVEAISYLFLFPVPCEEATKQHLNLPAREAPITSSI